MKTEIKGMPTHCSNMVVSANENKQVGEIINFLYTSLCSEDKSNFFQRTYTFEYYYPDFIDLIMKSGYLSKIEINHETNSPPKISLSELRLVDLNIFIDESVILLYEMFLQ